MTFRRAAFRTDKRRNGEDNGAKVPLTSKCNAKAVEELLLNIVSCVHGHVNKLERTRHAGLVYSEAHTEKECNKTHKQVN